MRGWLTGRWRLLMLAGVVVFAVALGVIWGVADAGRIEASAATSTTVSAGNSASTTTTTTLVTPTTLRATTTTSMATTTTSVRTNTSSNTSSGGGSGGSAPTTPTPSNQPPIIEDPGISSDGMELAIAPVVSDPDNDPVEVFFELDGTRLIIPQDADSATTTVTRGSDYVVDVSVAIGVTDSAGNEVVETFDHELQAVTTVTVRDLRFTVASSACFEEEAAQRIEANIQLRGAAEQVSNVSRELRADNSEVTLVDEATGELAGEPPSQRVFVLPALDGRLDSHDLSHSAPEEVLVPMFETLPCQGFLSYEIEMDTR